MHLLLATSNPHKLEEVKEILEPLGIEVCGLDSLSETFEEPVENADTFRGNARIKAVGYARATGKRCMADDSGLTVDALDGSPGVHSARYAGIGTSRKERDKANSVKLLRDLQEVQKEDRTARFVCAMCVADPDGTIVGESEGTFEGIVGIEPKGEHGFGYDSLLFIPEANKTSAEMSPEEKNKRSHRGKAVRSILSCFEL